MMRYVCDRCGQDKLTDTKVGTRFPKDWAILAFQNADDEILRDYDLCKACADAVCLFVEKKT